MDLAKTNKTNFIITATCLFLIVFILVFPLLFQTSKMYPLDSIEMRYCPTTNQRYEPIPIDVIKYPKVYTGKLDIYMLPHVYVPLILVAVYLAYVLVQSRRAIKENDKKMKQEPTK